jgi:hypothetical protein
MGAGPGDFGAERVLSAVVLPSAVTLIALTANGSGRPYDLLLIREI